MLSTTGEKEIGAETSPKSQRENQVNPIKKKPASLQYKFPVSKIIKNGKAKV